MVWYPDGMPLWYIDVDNACYYGGSTQKTDIGKSVQGIYQLDSIADDGFWFTILIGATANTKTDVGVIAFG